MALHHGDKRAAFVGLIAGAIGIFAVLYAITMLTNKKFEGHRPAAAEAAQH
jgi:hypothetical protein